MSETLLAGSVLGLGLFLLVRALFPARPGLVTRLLALDAAREGTDAPRARLVLPDEEVSAFRRGLGERMARFYATRGWEVRSAKADLARLVEERARELARLVDLLGPRLHHLFGEAADVFT